MVAWRALPADFQRSLGCTEILGENVKPLPSPKNQRHISHQALLYTFVKVLDTLYHTSVNLCVLHSHKDFEQSLEVKRWMRGMRRVYLVLFQQHADSVQVTKCRLVFCQITLRFTKPLHQRLQCVRDTTRRQQSLVEFRLPTTCVAGYY